jgi:radical SAM protein with 4Fe4S-binding SPASM domain
MTSRLFRCGAGQSQVVVDPYGHLQTCSLFRQESFDLRTGTVADGWRFLQQVVTQTITRPTRCRSCDKVTLCGSCPGNNSLESAGDMESPPDYLCEITYARIEAFCSDLRPRLPEPAGRVLPLHRRQPCERPWLATAEPIGTLIGDRARGRPLPVLT